MGGNVGNVNPAGEPLTTAASSTSGSSSAPRAAAKRRLETGTVSLEFLPGGLILMSTCTDNFAFCSSEALGTDTVPASEPRFRPAQSAAELLALCGHGVGVAPPAFKRR